MTCLLSHDLKGAEDAFDGALAIAHDLGSHRDEAWAMWHLAELSFYGNRVDEAEERLGRAEEAFRSAGDTGGIGWVRGLLGYVRLAQGRRIEAESLALSIVDEVRDRGDRWASAMTLVLLATVRLWEGRAEQAVDGATEALKLFSEINDHDGLMRGTATLARALAACGRVEEARSVVDDPTGLAAVAVATHLGDWRTVLAARQSDLELIAAEAAVTAAFALLQAGQVEEALSLLEEPSPSPYHRAVLSLALVSGRDPDRALDSADAALDARPEATYRDAAFAHLAQGFAQLQLGRLGQAREAIVAARRSVAPTDDVVTTAVVELGAARLERNDDSVSAALKNLESMGVPTDGWETLLRTAAGDY